jgi:hypothetical protein
MFQVGLNVSGEVWPNTGRGHRCRRCLNLFQGACVLPLRAGSGMWSGNVRSEDKSDQQQAR